MSTDPTPRRRNKRGEGAKLQDEILAAAGALLERGGSDDALTLRAIAREAGVTAPAIYPHFADRDEILKSVVTRGFGELAATLDAAAVDDRPVQRLLAICRAYLDFAAEHPQHYRMLFERHRANTHQSEQSVDVTSIPGADAFGVLLDAVRGCIADGTTTANSVEAATTRIWIGLHGQATLRASLPWFPWPDRDAQMAEIVGRLGDLDR